MADINTISYPKDAHVITRKLEDESFWYQHRNNMITAAVSNYISSNDIVYDMGGGNGVVTKALINKGYNCVLIEALPQAIDIAKARGIDHAVQSTIQDFNGTSLPTVLLLDVLEHIDNDESMLQQLFNQINSKGYLIITVPAFNHLTTDVDKDIGHFRRYTLKNLNDLLQKQGFVVKQKTYFFSLLYFPTLILRVLKYKLGIQSKDRTSRRQQEHLSNYKWLNNFIQKLFHWEVVLFNKKISIPLGTSCLVVAYKP
jgi:2-polyprenyl-3-methyl-5-hydroxy-6-metoxy-1,4-benzoquinol methylase